MLDDLKIFHEKDTADTLGATEHQTEQLGRKCTLKGDTTFSGIQNVVFAAMGGSAIAATFAQSWAAIAKPFEIVRGYDIPAYVGKDTLVVAASSSGNTEETLSALVEAEEKGAQIAVITGGGKLQQVAEEKGYLLAELPKLPFSRFNTFTNLRALTQILEVTGIFEEGCVSELESAAMFLNEACKDFRPDVSTAKNRAKRIAQELLGQSIVLYSGPKAYPAAYKWKVSFNENAKQVAWTGQYPEFNHNEFSGWSKQPVDKPYAVIELHSSFENERVQKRFGLSERLLSGVRPASLVVDLEGDTLLKQLLWGAMLGEYVSLYLAFASGVNPVPLPLVDKLKTALVA